MQPFDTKRLLVLLLLSSHVHSRLKEFDDSVRESILARAIVRIFIHVPIRQLTTLHFTRSEATQDDIISCAVDYIRTSHAYTIEDFEHVSDWYLRWFNIVFINGEKELSNFVKKLMHATFDPRGYYIVVVETVLTEEGRKNLSRTILKAFFELFYDNVITLFRDETDSTVFMYTFMPCDRSHACYEVQPFLYNTFDGTNFEHRVWHFPKKWTNFNGCSVSVAVNHFPPHILLSTTKQGSIHVNGVDAKILRMIAAHLNFTIDYRLANRGLIFDNGTGIGAFELLLNGKVNLIMAGYTYTNSRRQYLSLSVPYIQTEVVYALPVPLEIRSLDRLIYPLKKEIWIALHSIYCGAFIFLSILKRFGSKVYNFIVGDHTRSPCVDMMQMMYGVSFQRTPRYTFARCLFAIWLLSTFIISCTYRGRLVEILTSRTPRTMPQTIQELLELKYELIIRPQLESHVRSLYGNDAKFKLTDHMWNSLMELQTPSDHHRAVMEQRIFVKFFNAARFRNGVLPILPEILHNVNLVTMFRKNSYLVPIFNQVLHRFTSNGLTNKWIEEVMNKNSLDRLRTSGPKRLNMSHFAGTFQIYALAVGISILVFVIELLSLKWNVVRRIMLFYTE